MSESTLLPSEFLVALLLYPDTVSEGTARHNITDANGAIEDGRIFWSPLHNDKLRKPAVQL